MTKEAINDRTRQNNDFEWFESQGRIPLTYFSDGPPLTNFERFGDRRRIRGEFIVDSSLPLQHGFLTED